MKRNTNRGNFSADLFDDIDESVAQLDVMASEAVTTNKTYIAVDNGVSGTIAILRPDNSRSFFRTPVKYEQSYTKSKKTIARVDFNKLLQLLDIAPPVLVIMERPFITNDPKKFHAVYSGGRALEATVIAVEWLNLPFQYIDSRNWQKQLLPQGMKGPELKEASLQIGNRLFPEFKDHSHKDRDSLLIAEYARRNRL